MAKPLGIISNLDCVYRFVLHTDQLYHGSGIRMELTANRPRVRQLLAANQGENELVFAVRRCEPTTLMDLGFFRRTVEVAVTATSSSALSTGSSTPRAPRISAVG